MSHLTPPRQLLDADASAPDPAAGTPAAPAETGTDPDAPSGAHPTDDGAEAGARVVEASEPGGDPEAVEGADADTSPGAEEQEDEAAGDEERGEAAGETSGEAAEETHTSLPAAADDERAPEGAEPHTGPATA
ncbi:hypothetical protein ABT404_42145, partial [Streptomyces hyaluromycini]